MPQVNGLYRLCPGAEIEPCSYDFETGRIGELQFTSPYGYSAQHFRELAAMPPYYLWKAMVDDPSWWAAYNVNNTYVMKVRGRFVLADNWYQEEVEGFCQDVNRPQRVLVHIGWVRTKPGCLDVTITPYKLFADLLTMQARVHGRWVPVDKSFVKDPDISLYRDLIDTTHEAVYLTEDGVYHYID